jgi:hypothetical protein
MFISNCQTKETVEVFFDYETDRLTIQQSHPDANQPHVAVSNAVTISTRMLASIVEELGLAEVEYIEDEGGDSD